MDCENCKFGEMTDFVNKQTRSKMMSAVRAKNGKFETEIRRRLFALGFRFRLHRRDLPGKPDIALAKYSAIIFINGCFWHYHGCTRSRIPESRADWWRKKLEENRRRDLKALSELQSRGWRTATIWECSVRRPGIDRQVALNEVCLRIGEFITSEHNSIVISGPMLTPGSERLL